MQEIRVKSDFNDWRKKARILLNAEIPPHEVHFSSTSDAQESLPGLVSETELSDLQSTTAKRYSVSPLFLSHAKFVSAHRRPSKWALIYRILWRLTHGEPELMRNSIDPDVIEFDSMYRSVRRDMHKMTAFVRFREVQMKTPEGQVESWFIAWHEPDHLIVPLTSKFFIDRFNGMNFTILTPDASLTWDRNHAVFGPGSSRNQAPTDDEVEDLWKTYYASIFNPARIKERTMKKEMAVRYWKNLPETALIPELIREAPSRLQEFYKNQVPSAESWLPPKEKQSLDTLRIALQSCKACCICEKATQAVFGEGPLTAEIVLVGEQPGDQEDLQGKPFVGPAGELLNQALSLAGIERSKVYLTNAVKHFKWIPRGKLRLHQRPTASEISACRPWLSAELSQLSPKTLICLGASAAQSILGKAVTLMDVRGKRIETPACRHTWITTHPSAILRTPEPAQREEAFSALVNDLKIAVLSHNLDRQD